jgi:protein-S-isoprenylcysteine O-methyltransferase Ste14
MKLTIFTYGILSYLAGVAGLLSLIACFIGLAPFGFLWGEEPLDINPWLWNGLLVGLWGAIHSVMARPAFKEALTKLIPEPAERSTYVLLAGITSVLLVGYWQSLPGHIWHIQSEAISITVRGLALFGWSFLLASTFAINHFDLFGLRQVFLNFKNQPRPPLQFTERMMYRFIRHPIQTGVLIGIWATPSMSTTHLLLSLGFTAYIAIGLWFEERDLITEHGDDYLAYRQRTGAVLPLARSRSASSHSAAPR